LFLFSKNSKFEINPSNGRKRRSNSLNITEWDFINLLISGWKRGQVRQAAAHGKDLEGMKGDAGNVYVWE